MSYLCLAWMCTLGFIFNQLSEVDVVAISPGLPLEHKIIGRWHLEDQEMLINGKEINRHFEEMAAQFTAKSGQSIDPVMLADKFRKGFRGIPSGTVFEFNDDFSYRIILPNAQIQEGLWRIKNTQMIVLNAQEQVMHMEIKSIGDDLATVAIKEEQMESNSYGGRYLMMELIMDLSR